MSKLLRASYTKNPRRGFPGAATRTKGKASSLRVATLTGAHNATPRASIQPLGTPSSPEPPGSEADPALQEVGRAPHASPGTCTLPTKPEWIQSVSRPSSLGDGSPLLDSQRAGFCSAIFLVPKKESEQVVNLNRFLPRVHFKMEGVHVVRDLLQKGDWMCRIDLKDAYFAIPICRKHQSLLRFIWGSEMYQFTCLPFGLASAPRVFTKVLRPVVGFLRLGGVRCVIYLDDLLIMAGSRDQAALQCAAATRLLECLGFLMNYSKSQTQPTQELTFLGLNIDSRKEELSLPCRKLSQIRKQARKLLGQTFVSAREIAQFVGKLSATVLAIHPAPLHYRGLQHLKHQAL